MHPSPDYTPSDVAWADRQTICTLYHSIRRILGNALQDVLLTRTEPEEGVEESRARFSTNQIPQLLKICGMYYLTTIQVPAFYSNYTHDVFL